jgi:hypothetical protein
MKINTDAKHTTEQIIYIMIIKHHILLARRNGTGHNYFGTWPIHF